MERLLWTNLQELVEFGGILRFRVANLKDFFFFFFPFA